MVVVPARVAFFFLPVRRHGSKYRIVRTAPSPLEFYLGERVHQKAHSFGLDLQNAPLQTSGCSTHRSCSGAPGDVAVPLLLLPELLLSSFLGRLLLSVPDHSFPFTRLQ